MPAVTPPRSRPGVFARLSGAGDDRLVARIRAGDERCFELIYERYHRRLLSFCRHMLGTREEAEDALQQVFVAAHRQLLADARTVELRPWLYAIARNRCLSMLRARRQTVALEDIPGADGLGLAVAAEVEQREDLKDILLDIAKLPEDQRAALLLSELEDLTHEQIAATLDVRREKVKALVFQARESLMGYRQAREADCEPIREQLATLRGSALRRGDLRRHVEVCAGCAQFKDEVTRQRALVAAVLPVVPALGLKERILEAAHSAADVTGVAAAGGGAAAVGAATGGGATGAASAGAGAGASAAGGGSTLAATGAAGLASKVASSGLAAKVLAVTALAASAGGGAVAVHDARHQTPRPARSVSVRSPTRPAGTAIPAAATGAARPAAAVAVAGGPNGGPAVASAGHAKATEAKAKAAKAQPVASHAAAKGHATKTTTVKAPKTSNPHSQSRGPAASTTTSGRAAKPVKAPKAAKVPKARPATTVKAAKPVQSGKSAKPLKAPKAAVADPALTETAAEPAKTHGPQPRSPK